MSGDGSSSAELDRLAEEFVERTRRGEGPSISAYTRANPDLAVEIQDLFPLLLELEGGVADAEPAGRELGDYVLLREIGRGGMGVVYEAVQKTLGRRVALKILPQQMTLDPRFLERFRLEAQAAARLQHPHIVPVIGWGEHEGVYYFTMQYVDGCGLDEVLGNVRRLAGGSTDTRDATASGSSLAARMLSTAWKEIDRKTAPATLPAGQPALGRTYYDNAARFVLQAAEGIAAAHARGVLHRDVKPSNLLLDERGRVWVSDFGLCKETESDGLTQPGDLLGTFRYMAPERFEGVSDVQGDVYGLGMTLYELLARKPAYRGDDRAALAAQIVNTAPERPRKIDPKIPRDLELIVLKASARDRSRRYATADALAEDLRAYLEHRPISARPPTFGYVLRSAVRRHKTIAAITIVALLALVGSTAFYVNSLREKEAVARFRQYVANIAAAETALRDGDIPVARRLLDEAPEEYRNWEWRHLRSRLDRSLRSFERWQWPVRLVAHNPAGTRLATCAGGQTKILDDATGELLAHVQHRTHTRSISWHPEGTAFAVGSFEGFEVWSWPAAERIVDEQVGAVRAVCFTPDGKRLAVGGHDGVLTVWDLESAQAVFKQPLHSQIHAVAVDPTGRYLAAGTLDATIAVCDLEADTLLWRTPCGRRAVRSLSFVGSDLVAAPSSDGHVQVRGVADGTLVRVLGHEHAPAGVASSTDGQRLLSWDRRQVHIWEPRWGERLVTYGNDSTTICGSFHPDGTRVVTGSNRGTVSEWFVPPGRDSDLCVIDNRAAEGLAFAPSGSVFVAGGPILRVFDAETREEARNWIGHRAEVIELQFSPDGAWVASSDYGGEVLIWHVPTDTLTHRLSAVPDADHRRVHLAFASDSKRLFTVGSDGALAIWDVASGAELSRIALHDSWLTSVATSHDGRFVAIGDYQGGLRLLDARTLEVLRERAGHTSLVTDIAFQVGGPLMASSGFDRAVRLWDVETGEPVRTLRSLTSDSSGVADALLTVSFLSDGSRVLASSADCSAKLWDTATGRLVATLRGSEQGWMHGARFSPDASRLVTLEAGGLVRAWESESFRRRLARHAPDPATRAEATRAWEAAQRTSDDPDSAIAAIRARKDLSEAGREAALRTAYRARATDDALIERMWRTLLPAEGDPTMREVVLAIASDRLKAGTQSRLPRGERETVWALGAYRCERFQEVTTRERIARLVSAPDDKHLHAVDLAVICMALARQDKLKQARSWMRRLQDLLVEHPAIREARGVEALVAEAKALLD